LIDVSKYVRVAKQEDVPDLIRFARNFHKSSPYKWLRFDQKKVKESFERVTSSPGTDMIALIAYKGDENIGMVVAAADSPPFSSEKVSTELAWWVEPEHRKTRAALFLFEAYEEWARRVGCRGVQSAYLLDTNHDPSEFYIKKGYTEVESSFLKGVL
jgi:GNAT superfamily N-acetyltransferase